MACPSRKICTLATSHAQASFKFAGREFTHSPVDLKLDVYGDSRERDERSEIEVHGEEEEATAVCEIERSEIEVHGEEEATAVSEIERRR